MTSYNGSVVSNDALDIDGMTDIGVTISGDLIIVDDGAMMVQIENLQLIEL